MTPTPKVTVVVPCYNSAVLLAATVDSVVAQISSDWELVLVDDGSTDDTSALIAQLMARYRDCAIRTLAQVNGGVAAARNHGIAQARGRYILPLDADDLIAPTMLEACGRVLDDQPQTSLVFTDREDFGALTGEVAAGRFELPRLKYFNQLASCSMYRRTMWEAIGGYRTNVSGFDDWDFWLAAAMRGFQGNHLAQPMFRHRRRPGSQLETALRDYERLFATIILNNQEAYSGSEIAAARDYLGNGKPAALLQAGRRIFENAYRMPG